FFEMNITKQVEYILSQSGQLGIAAVINPGDGSTGKITLYAYENFSPIIPTRTKPWTTDGNTCHLLLEIENGTLEYKPGASVDRKKSPLVEIQLTANPNPFNPTTNIVYNCGHNKSGLIRLYSTSGQLILSKQVTGAGNINLNGTNLSSGLYFCKLETNSKSSIISLLLSK
ncbi:MAG: T9SS type A sorting domain-containing protein, partial [Fibrobacteres bacterium]|nr:T9SS type A sorting domain-containing protein [Fibrobacterota bacterium]